MRVEYKKRVSKVENMLRKQYFDFNIISMEMFYDYYTVRRYSDQ